MRKLREWFYNKYTQYREIVSKSIRLEIIALVLFSLGVSYFIGCLTGNMLRGMGIGEYHSTDYNRSRNFAQQKLTNAVHTISALEGFNVTLEYDLFELKTIIKNKEESESLRSYIERNLMVESSYLGELEEVYEIKNQFLEQYAYEITNLELALEKLGPEEWTKEIIDPMFTETLKKMSLTDEGVRSEYIQLILEDLNTSDYGIQEMDTYLLNSEGEAQYTTGLIKAIDLIQVIKQTSQVHQEEHYFNTLYPISLDSNIYYLYTEAYLDGDLSTYYSGTSSVIGFIVGSGLFVFLVFNITTKKMRYIEYLSSSLHEISKGDFSYEVEVEGQDELARLAQDMNQMQAELKNRTWQREQAEKTKNELITNVAHDLRTPLTSIIGYMGLVKDEKYETQEEAQKYLDIAYNKSEKLKVLMEDLFEYTKLSSGVLELKRDVLSMTTLMNQLIEEMSPLAEEKEIQIDLHIKTDKTKIEVDLMKMTRVFENLLENAIKYTEPKQRVVVIIQGKQDVLYTTIRNKVQNMSEEEVDKLFERFYRSDASRNSNTGGSGLGLAISKSIVEMHGGKIWGQLDGTFLGINVKLKRLNK